MLTIIQPIFGRTKKWYSISNARYALKSRLLSDRVFKTSSIEPRGPLFSMKFDESLWEKKNWEQTTNCCCVVFHEWEVVVVHSSSNSTHCGEISKYVRSSTDGRIKCIYSVKDALLSCYVTLILVSLISFEWIW